MTVFVRMHTFPMGNFTFGNQLIILVSIFCDLMVEYD